jgi:hypothetical protein
MKYASINLCEKTLKSLRYAYSQLEPEEILEIEQALATMEDEETLKANRISSPTIPEGFTVPLGALNPARGNEESPSS